MFLENNIYNSNRAGWIEIITGSMFSGKTEELLRRLKRAELAGLLVEVYKPMIDSRYSSNDVVSHNNNSVTAMPVAISGNILMLTNNANVVGIDEAQFFDSEIISVCQELAKQGKRVIVAGLDMDYNGNPFGPMPQLMAIAEYVTKVQAICTQCGNLSYLSHRKTNDKQLVLLGEQSKYEPLCRTCFYKATSNNSDK